MSIPQDKQKQGAIKSTKTESSSSSPSSSGSGIDNIASQSSGSSPGPGPAPSLPIGSKDKSVGWYDPPITAVSPAVRDLLEGYAGIPADEVIPRILEVVCALFSFSFSFSFLPSFLSISPSVFSIIFLPLFLSFHSSPFLILSIPLLPFLKKRKERIWDIL